MMLCVERKRKIDSNEIKSNYKVGSSAFVTNWRSASTNVFADRDLGTDVIC